MRVVLPTIVRPLRQEIAAASKLKDLLAIRTKLLEFRVLDPACGSGNFLYVAYRELAKLETELLSKIRDNFTADTFAKNIKSSSLISPKQFFGIDIDPFGVEIAKVTLMIAKKLTIDDAFKKLGATDDEQQRELGLSEDEALPLDNLDENIRCADALFSDWPPVDAIVSNPPYQSKNKMQEEYGRAYVNDLREAFPDVPGRADYCVYWFRKTHDHLKDNQRAGLVGTNTIRQNYSREGSLDYIVHNGGTITEAVASQVWSGDAVVHVSIVNWIKGSQKGKKSLMQQLGDSKSSPWESAQLDVIPPTLSFGVDVSSAEVLQTNKRPKVCFQGQTHGHEGFLLAKEDAVRFLKADPRNEDIIFPYLIAENLIGSKRSQPKRFVIDFGSRGQLDARTYKDLFQRIEDKVLPDREKSAKKEEKRNKEAVVHNSNAKTNKHHANFLNHWWQLSYSREDLKKAIEYLPRYVVCGQVTKRPIFEFISDEIRPNAALMVFAFADDYSFGVLQSDLHWKWFTNRCSTLKGDFRYTSNTVFDSFPWPQAPTKANVKRVAEKACELRKLRRELLKKHDFSLRELYASMENPGKHPLKDAQEDLDATVHKAYGMKKRDRDLEFLLSLNIELAEKESKAEKVQGPGLPGKFSALKELFSSNCVKFEN